MKTAWIPFLLLAACAKAPVPATEPAPGNEEVAAPEADPVSLAVLIEGHALWLGNDSYADDPQWAYPGVYQELVPALDGFRGVGPDGSRVALMTYGRGAAMRADWADAATFAGASLGTQQALADAEPNGHVQRDLVVGIEQARALLAAAGGRRVLVVFGDGADTVRDDGVARLGALGEQLHDDGVEVYAVFYETELEGDLASLQALTAEVKQLDSKDGLAGAVQSIGDAIGRAP